MARIWRVAFTDSSVQRNLVIVEADEVEREKVSEFPRLAQEVLAMQSCKDCDKDWPFEGVLGMNELLKQVGMGSWHATYLNYLFQHRELHAIGLGSRKDGRKRAGLLGLTIAGLLAGSLPPPLELDEYLRRAKEQPLKLLELCPGNIASMDATSGRDEDWTHELDAQEPWVPEAGSWMWWMDPKTLAVLCEDVGAQIFAGANMWLSEVAASANWIEEDGKSLEAFRLQVEKVFPDIFCFPTLFQQEPYDYQVVGIGRDIKHRRRAACLGFAALRSWQDNLEGQRWLVVEELRRCGWFPQHRLERFWDLDTCGFWLNMQRWRKGYRYEQPLQTMQWKEVGQPFSDRDLSDIRMNCQPALLEELKRHGSYAEIDLTKSTYPWPKIMAGHAEKDRIVGHGVERFAVVADSEQSLDAYQESELIHFVVDCVGGQRHRFDSLKRTHATKWEWRTPNDETLAFRLAAGWSVRKRWEAYVPNVFQNLIRDFKAKFRPQGWCDKDWKQPNHKSHAHAWRLASDLENDFNQWLCNKTARCEAAEEVRDNADFLKESFEEAVAGFCRAGDTADHADSMRMRKTESCFEMFSPLQKLMLDDVLRQGDTCRLLRPLDPSRSEGAEQTYWPHWHRADEDIRFAHVNVSEKFRHGHPGQSLDTLIHQLTTSPRSSWDIPALVAVRIEGILYVVMGNRRLKCYKQAYEEGGEPCWFKVITHNFPTCDSIEDPATCYAFKLKAIQAMTTINLGKDVKIQKRRHW
eukprot:s3413_g3.t1